MKHTPGPWTNMSGGIVSGPGTHGVVCYLRGSDEEQWALANAYLIAAAPELLEALEQIAKGEGRWSSDHLQHAINTIEDMRELAQQAITKAQSSAND